MCKQSSCCCNCCNEPKAKQKCPVHSSQIFRYVCSTPQCLQLLCEKCISNHKQNHRINKLGQSNLVHLRSVQNFYFQSIDSELQNIQQIKKNKNKQIGKPEEVIQKFVDEFIYGSIQRKQKLLNQSQQSMKNNYNTKMLIRLMERDNQVQLGPGFKQKYFRFLDQLIQDSRKKY